MAFLAKIAVSGKGGPLGKMADLADFQDLEGGDCARTPYFPSTHKVTDFIPRRCGGPTDIHPGLGKFYN